MNISIVGFLFVAHAGYKLFTKILCSINVSFIKEEKNRNKTNL